MAIAEVPADRRPVAGRLWTLPAQLLRRLLRRVDRLGGCPRALTGLEGEHIGQPCGLPRFHEAEMIAVEAIGDDGAEGHPSALGLRDQRRRELWLGPKRRIGGALR